MPYSKIHSLQIQNEKQKEEIKQLYYEFLISEIVYLRCSIQNQCQI